MSHRRNNPRADRYRRRRPACRGGLTLIELLMVTSILVMMAGAMAALATVVQSGAEFHHENSVVTQSGRVALERIERAISSATASDEFPGCFVYSEQLDAWNFPDTLIVWCPRSAAVDPDGRPMINELVVFCPHPGAPTELLEIRLDNASGSAPALDDTTGWQSLMAEFKLGNGAQRVTLTDLLRAAAPPDSEASIPRGAVRFDVRLRPSAAEWSEFQMGSRDWGDLSWAQGIHGSGTGLRQTWCRIELQLQIEHFSAADAGTATPFFGSATGYHELHRS